MYTHGYSFNPDLSLHEHFAECSVKLLNQADRNNYPHNPDFVEDTANLPIPPHKYQQS